MEKLEKKQLSDEEWYEIFMKGDNEGLENIYNKYKARLLDFSNSIVRNIDVAEEIVQDVFEKICNEPEKYNKEYTVKSYIYMMCHSKSVTYINTAQRRARIEDTYLKNTSSLFNSDLSEKLTREEDIELLRSSLASLKLEYRIVLELTEFHKLSIKEVSLILHKTEGATKVLKFRAKEKLEKVMKKKMAEKYDKSDSKTTAYNKRMLQIIIVILCIATISTTAVYATIKKVVSVLNSPKVFKLTDYNEEIVPSDEYITKEEAIDKIKYYLEVLGYEGYNCNDLEENTTLFCDIIVDEVYWRYMISNSIEIRVKAEDGKLNLFNYKGDVWKEDFECKKILYEKFS